MQWIAAAASGVYFCGTMIEGTVLLNWPDYAPQAWQTLLVFFAVALVALVVNTIFARFLPKLESFILVIHVCGFFAILIPLLHFGKPSSTKEVFETWLNEGEWSTRGMTFLVGVTTPIYNFVGADGASHMGMFLICRSFGGMRGS